MNEDIHFLSEKMNIFFFFPQWKKIPHKIIGGIYDFHSSTFQRQMLYFWKKFLFCILFWEGRWEKFLLLFFLSM